MAKIAIVYESKGGHTLQYAKWLKEALSADMFEVSKVNVQHLLNYELILFGGGVYMNKINVVSFIKKHFDVLMFKKIIVFAVCGSKVKPEMEALFIDKNYSDGMKDRFPLFQLRGGIDKKKLSVPDKLLATAMKAQISKKDDRSNDDIEMLGILEGMSDYTNKENINLLVDFIQKGKWKLA